MTQPAAPAVQFVTAARSTERTRLPVWTYCPSPQCLTQQDHVWDGKRGVYVCERCGKHTVKAVL